MIGYLGVPGAMARLPYRGGLDTQSDRPVSFTRTLGGKRKAFVGARARREWSVSVDLLASRDVHGLVAVAQSGGSVMWYPADAASGNLLSPQASGWESIPANATDTGLVALPDGSVARAVTHSGSGTISPGNAHGTYEMVPVFPGAPVTLGGWGLGGIRFTGFWRDATQQPISNFAAMAHAFTGWQWREGTFTPPAGAAFVQMVLSAGAQYARPSIAWGAQGADRPGRGCPAAVVHGLSEGLSVISQDDTFGSIDLTVTEVG